MSNYLSGSYDDCLQANTILLARAQDAEAELTRLRAQQTVFVEALRAVTTFCKVPSPGHHWRWPQEYYDAFELADKALATLDVPEGKYDLRETVDRLRTLDVPPTKEGEAVTKDMHQARHNW